VASTPGLYPNKTAHQAKLGDPVSKNESHAEGQASEVPKVGSSTALRAVGTENTCYEGALGICTSHCRLVRMFKTANHRRLLNAQPYLPMQGNLGSPIRSFTVGPQETSCREFRLHDNSALKKIGRQ